MITDPWPWHMMRCIATRGEKKDPVETNLELSCVQLCSTFLLCALEQLFNTFIQPFVSGVCIFTVFHALGCHVMVLVVNIKTTSRYRFHNFGCGYQNKYDQIIPNQICVFKTLLSRPAWPPCLWTMWTN